MSKRPTKSVRVVVAVRTLSQAQLNKVTGGRKCHTLPEDTGNTSHCHTQPG